MPQNKPTFYLTVFLVIACLCGFFYSNSLHNPFIWDDDGLIVKNPVIRSWLNLPKAFSSDLYSGVALGANFYRPLQSISYMWDYHFWQLDPYGYHITNIFLQVLVAFLVFLLGCFILKEKKIAIAAAIFFALNPLHTEAVTYISGRAEMLMAVFLLSSLLLFIKGRNLFAWVAFVFALLSKELAVVFPLIILAYILYYRRQELKKKIDIVKLVLPFLAIVLLYLLLRLTLLNFTYTHPPALAKYPFILRLMVLPDIIFTYFKLLVLPVGLHMSWTLNRLTAPVWVCLNWVIFIAICFALAFLLRKYKSRKAFGFMLAWFVVFLAPQAGILPINAFIAEHFLYLPSISFFMLVAWLLNKYLRRNLFYCAVILLAIFYGSLTFTRNFDWQDAEVFYKKIITFSPNSFQAHNNLGLQFEYKHLYDLACIEYKKALEIEPSLIEARSNLANLYFKMGKFREARKEYSAVEKNVPPNKAGELQNNIGCVYEVEGARDLALARYKLALSLDPGLNFAHFNIARVYAANFQPDLATLELIKSLPEIKPNLNDRKYREVISTYLKLTKNFHTGVIFYNDLGIQLASANLFDGAIASFKRVIELDPLYADAHFNLGLAYWKKGLKREAIFEFKQTLKINPNHLNAKE
ncbi:MAG: tetratricopeptide repeat protein, partial [Candidatus Omnitrophica bacterium]|nr:tetratricopeptide repeat protein [Candidatus Omnitrophota bacterium]